MLPRAHRSTIDESKIRDYLLSQTHPVGRFKSVFFFALGYEATRWERLRDDLLKLAVDGDCTPGQSSPFGQKYEVSGKLRGPNGREGNVVTVWLLPDGGDAPRLITAYPG